ncbi:MAG: SAM-dependent methyltransferase [Desulfobacterales bacterium]|nr:SAM-dependent methyltransferase [Desulfobacterales bacterium]
MSTTPSPESTAKERDAFVARLLTSTAGAFDIFTLYIGDRLGFYRSLAEHGASTAGELAARTGAYERYVREWLEQQTVAGILGVEDEHAAAGTRRYRLPAGHQEVLVDRDSLNYLAPLVQMVVGAVRPMHQLLKAYRSGKGVPYPYYGADFREGQAAMNRAMFLRQLGPGMAAVDDGGSPAPAGGSSGARGRHRLRRRLVQLSASPSPIPRFRWTATTWTRPSVALAQANVAEAGLGERVRIQHRDAADPSLRGGYDLVTAFECVHDMSDPVGALRTMLGLARGRRVGHRHG